MNQDKLFSLIVNALNSILTIRKFYFLTQHKGGGFLVPNIWVFGSRILTSQYFWLKIFVIVKIVVGFLLAEKNDTGRVDF